ncbi:hypothetical protein BHE74_00053559, partial [Ensete ventricosum]
MGPCRNRWLGRSSQWPWGQGQISGSSGGDGSQDQMYRENGRQTRVSNPRFYRRGFGFKRKSSSRLA